jgi:endonuclease I
MTLGIRRTTVLIIVAFVASLTQPPTYAATPLTVASAIASQNGTSQTVRGYVVGQPTATSTVVTSDYPNDYALAIADTAGETSTSRMLYVQIPSAFRAQWGLRTNPSLRGKQIDVTGALTAYFSHPGMTGTTAFALAAGSGGGTTPGPWDSTYYASALGKSGAALRAELHAIIKIQSKLSYDQVWTALKSTDQDPSNTANVIELYSGRSISKTLNGGDPDDWNREHVWAQSHGSFGTATGPGTDLHHLRPEDVTVNSTRGNKDFDLGGTAVSQCSDCWTDSDSFEPRDSVKGDVARMLFYMAIRYEGEDGWPNLELNNSVNGSTPWHGKLSILLQWNAEDPPSSFEQRRNDVIYESYQHNRNPFIDHPEWAGAIWS